MKPDPEPPSAAPLPSAQTLALITDALAWPLLLLRPDGSLVHANRAGLRALQQRKILTTLHGNRVLPADAAQRPAFNQALAAAALQPQQLSWAAGGERVSLTLSALRGPQQQHPLLLLALSADAARVADLRTYAVQQGLSDAETRVLLHLAKGESSAKVAARLGVSAATVRSQSVSLRRKTGHPSVAALLRTLATLPLLAPGTADGEK